MASIILHRCGVQMLRFPLERARVTLGRGDHADLELADPNFPEVFAHLLAENGRHRVVATRGYQVCVAGNLVSDALLEDGEEVSFGSYGFIYEREAEEPATGGGVQELGDMISADPAMHRVFALIRRTAALNVTVLIGGESGTGKELVASALHQLSARAGGPYVPLNCGGMVGQLIASELYGHERGAFTGAGDKTLGAFAEAHGGTLFLDEIGEMPLDAQPHLLRAVETGEFRRVGSNAPTRVDTRIIAATNRNLIQEVGLGRFRRDLFYRLSVALIDLPPLRHRRCDIIPLWHRLVARLGDGARLELTARAEQKLLHHAWPGNVRELRNVAQRALLQDRKVIGPEGILFDPLVLARPQDLIDPEGLTLAQLEGRGIHHALQRSGGNVEQAARKLGVERSLLRRRMATLEVGNAEKELPKG
jgi:DNA-binding NtrC family response regulator